MQATTGRVIAVLAVLILFGGFGVTGFAGPANDSALESRVRRLEDHEAIERVLMEYGKALDQRDFTAYSQLFAQNGEWIGSTGAFKGPAAIKLAMEKAFPAPQAGTPAAAPGESPSFHLLTNAIIDIEGDRATATSKWSFVRLADGRPQIALAGRYDDTFIREKGQWKFLRREAPAITAK